MISVRMSSNEKPRDDKDPRAKRVAAFCNALLDDPRFEWKGYEQIPVDLEFSNEVTCSENFCIDGHLADYSNCMECGGTGRVTQFFNIELKEPADYVSSALGPSGHLYSQVLTMRELEHPCMVLVLGSDEDVTEAIKDATKVRYVEKPDSNKKDWKRKTKIGYSGLERAYQIGSYNDRLINLESNCEALGCRVVRWKASPWKRLLSLVHKVLTGGNLMSYRGKPANGERALVAAAMLLGNGIGCKVLEPVMEHYDLMLVPKGKPVPVGSLPGIGPKRAAVIDERIKMVYGV